MQIMFAKGGFAETFDPLNIGNTFVYLKKGSVYIVLLQQYKKNCNIIFQKWGEGRVKGRLEFFPKIHPIW